MPTNYLEFADDRSRYEAAESDAWQAHRGLWKQRHPQAPWEFRKMARKLILGGRG